MIPDRQARPYDAIDPRIPRVRRRVRRQRMDICRGCEFLNGLEQCVKCGCFMPVKTMLPHAFCPLDKWQAETEENPDGV